MTDSVEGLKEARAARDALKQRLAEERAAVMDAWTEANREDVDRLERLQGAVETLDATVRVQAVAAFRETGEKRPFPGVEVKEETVLEYERDAAFSWAKEHGICLSLDVAAFEKVARDLVIPDVVLIAKEPKVFIAKDLAKALDTGAPVG